MSGLRGGFLFNRFGDETGADLSAQQVDDKLLKLQTEFIVSVKEMFDSIKQQLRNDFEITKTSGRLEKLESRFKITKTFIDVRNKRLVSVDKGTDRGDAVNKEQLDEIGGVAIATSKLFDHSVEVIKVNAHRRIGAVSRSKEPNDVVVRIEINELRNELMQSITQINEKLEDIIPNMLNAPPT